MREARPDVVQARGLTIEVSGAASRSSGEETAWAELPVLPRGLADLLARPASSAPEDIRRSLHFGVSQPIVIPAAQVNGVETLLRPESQASAQVILQAESIERIKGKTVALRLFDSAGKPLGTYAGAVSHAGLGQFGSALEFSFHQGLDLVLCIPFANGNDGGITTRLNLDGLDPEATRRSTALLLALHRAATADLELDGHHLAKVGGFSTDRDQEYLKTVQMMHEEADDLAFIQNETGVYFPMPDQFDGYQRLWMRAIRLMLEGHAAPIPRRVFSAKAWPDLEPEAMREEGTVAIPMSGQNVTLAGQPVPIPPFFIYHPHVRITGLREAAEDAARGVDEPREFEVTPVDGTPFVAYFPDRLRVDAEQSTPWGLTGVEEPPPTRLHRAS